MRKKHTQPTRNLLTKSQAIGRLQIDRSNKLETPREIPSENKVAEYPVSRDLAMRIAAMHDALKRESGYDFAYTIVVHGNTVAASNMRQGHVEPNAR